VASGVAFASDLRGVFFKKKKRRSAQLYLAVENYALMKRNYGLLGM
jgi:hypothetical protein